MTPVPQSRASEADVRQRTCQECGHLCDQAGEFHPFMFCVLKKAGRLNPWEDFAWAYERLTGNSLPARPPAVRDLPFTASSSSEQPSGGLPVEGSE